MNSTDVRDLYCGADLHGNNVVLHICDSSGAKVFARRVKTNLHAVLRALEAFQERLSAIAVESTFDWYWFVDGLLTAGYDVRLANPAKMEQYDGLKVTDDESDAAWLAEMLRLGILPESYIYPEQIRSLRDALRRRQLFMRQYTQTLLSLESLLARYGKEHASLSEIENWTLPDIRALDLDDFARLQVSTLAESLRKSRALAKQIEVKAFERVKPTESFERIHQVPGIGKILGMTIALEAGDFGRFPSAGDYASYCRTVKSERGSNKKKKGRNNAKNGNRYLAWAYIEAATFAVRYYPPIKTWYERKKRRRNVAVAKKALACKLAKATWHVMSGKEFEMDMLFK